MPIASCCLLGAAIVVTTNAIPYNFTNENVDFLQNNDYVNISLNSISKIEKILMRKDLIAEKKILNVKYSIDSKINSEKNELIHEIANAVELQNSFIVKKLIEIDKINEIKNKFSSYIIDLYTNPDLCAEHQNKQSITLIENDYDLEVENHCGSVFSGHFWDACSKQLWTSSVGALAYAYVPIMGLVQFFIIIAQGSQNNWVGVTDAIAGFDISTPQWLIDTVVNTAKTVKSWKNSTRCNWTYYVTHHFKI